MASNQFAHAARKSSAMGPSVKNLLARYGLDATQISATGPHQTLLKGDVLAYVSQHRLEPGSSQTQTPAPAKVFKSNLDLNGYQPKQGPEGFSRIAKELLK